MATVKRTLISHYLETAPADPFSPDGPKSFRVVAADPGTGTIVKLTDVHATPECAMAEYEATLKLGLDPEIGDPERPVRAFELAAILGQMAKEIDLVNGALRRENDMLRHSVAQMEAMHSKSIAAVIDAITAIPKLGVTPTLASTTRREISAQHVVATVTADNKPFVNHMTVTTTGLTEDILGGTADVQLYEVEQGVLPFKAFGGVPLDV